MVRLILTTILEILGIVAIITGIALVSVPAALIVGGLIAVGVGYVVDPPVRAPKPAEEVKQE